MGDRRVVNSKWGSAKVVAPKICLVAVDVRSAHNVGSLFRTCDGFGAELFLVGICPRPEHEGDCRLPHIAKKAQKDISKTALGAEGTVKWRYVDTLQECSDLLRREGYALYAVEQADNSEPINKMAKTKDTAIVVGRELEGLCDEELKLCDKTYEIQMVGKKESFNVSVAAAIALYQLQ